MIVVFSTRRGRITLLGESASRLLALAGHSGTVPSAVLAADLPAFRTQLRSGLELHGDEPSPPPAQAPAAGAEADEDAVRQPPPVSLRKRSVPLLEMIDTAIAAGSDLMWERG